MEIAKQSTRLGRALLVLSLTASLLCSGCASQPQTLSESTSPSGSNQPLSPDEQQIRDDANVFNQTVVQGSLVGAGLGILAGVLIGATTGRVDNMVKYGVVGGVTGGVLGGVDGYMVAKRQEAGNNRVRMIQAMTRDVERDTERVQSTVASSTRVLEDSKQQLTDVQAQVAAKQADVAEAESVRKRVEQNRDVMAATLKALKKRRDNYQEASAETGGDTTELDAQIAHLNDEISKLEQNVAAMNEALAVSRV